MESKANIQVNFNIFKNSQFSFISKLLKSLPESELFAVGGAVRDLLLGKTPTEFDFIIRNVPAEKLEKTLAKLGDVDLVGKNFGVFKFCPQAQEQSYDIALPRTDHAWGTGGFRDVDVQSDPTLPIEKDLERRDFTINAMAIKIESGIPEGPRQGGAYGAGTNQESRKNFPSHPLSPIFSLIDPFDGVSDIKQRTIRAVGSPHERFQEDYSRMLRALRFAAQLGFTIEKETWNTLISLIPHINDEKENQRIVPAETIAKEFLKSLSYNPLTTMDLWDASGAFEQLIPELLRMKGCPQPANWHNEGDVWTHTRLCFEKMTSQEFKTEFTGAVQPSINLLLAVLFHDMGKPFTLKTPEKDGTDRIRFDEHDTVGAELFRKIADRLRFAAPEKFNGNPTQVAWLIKHHLLLINGPIAQLKNTTIERYFFNPLVPGADLLKLFWLDASATIPQDSHDTLVNYQDIKQRLAALAGSRGPTLPPPLLDGKEIMNLTGLKPGKKVGELKELLREEQLKGSLKTKNEAIEYIKSRIS